MGAILRGVGSVLMGLGKMAAVFVAQSPGVYLRKRRALAIFEAELRAAGLDERAVRKFKQAYGRMARLGAWLDSRR